MKRIDKKVLCICCILLIIIGLIVIVKISKSFIKSDTYEFNISAEDVLDIINNVFENEGIDDNYVDSYIEEKTNSVIVEMKDISINKQEEFINYVFPKRTGSMYIKYIKEHSMIEFKQAKEAIKYK